MSTALRAVLLCRVYAAAAAAQEDFMSTNLQIGIVGLPNVGKSTLFNAITKAGAEAANFPFCTIEPNVGVVEVPDHRLYDLADMFHPKKTTPAFTRFVDIAGLVAGASRGEGLGNQFLSHIRETDAIAHVVRCFENSNITHVEGSVDPVRDMDIINTELCLADLDSVDKKRRRPRSSRRQGLKTRKRSCRRWKRSTPLFPKAHRRGSSTSPKTIWRS